MQPYPPLGTLYAAPALGQRACPSPSSTPCSKIPSPASSKMPSRSTSRRLVVIYEDDFNFVTKMCLTHMRELAMRPCNDRATSRGIPVIAHGSDATDSPTLTSIAASDYVLNGEAEHTLTDLCHALLLETGLPASSAWPVFPSEQGQLQSQIRPCPRRQPGPRSLSPRVTSSTSSPTGLPGRQQARPLLDQRRLQPRLPVSMQLVREAHLRQIAFTSVRCKRSPRDSPAQDTSMASNISGSAMTSSRSTVTGSSASPMPYTSLRIKPLPFKIQSRADLMSETTVDALQRAGCAEVWMGVESGSQKDPRRHDQRPHPRHRHRTRAASRRRHPHLLLSPVRIPRRRLAEIARPSTSFARLARTTSASRSPTRCPVPSSTSASSSSSAPSATGATADDLCSIHTAAYQGYVFYHALRDALHAEVDAGMPGQSRSLATALWPMSTHSSPSAATRNLLELPEEDPPQPFYRSESSSATGRNA